VGISKNQIKQIRALQTNKGREVYQQFVVEGPKLVEEALASRVDIEAVYALEGALTLALDRINDPGNLGTLLRIADWFGMKQLICSPDSVSYLNPKVVQASMGAVFRIPVFYQPLREVCTQFQTEQKGTVYMAHMKGESMYESKVELPAMLVLGSESHGVEQELLDNNSFKPIHIPGNGQAESLNVAVSAGILSAQLLKP